jgi:phosphoribosylformylglycinamidine (FGAM) synthase-like enzyme
VSTGERLHRTTARYLSAKGATRSALGKALRELVATAIGERHELDAWLAEKDCWFWRNPNSPKRGEREDAWVAVLDEYAVLGEAIGAAENALGVATPAATAWAVRPGTPEWGGWAARVMGVG